MKSASTIKRPAPLSIRLNDAERDDLLHRANGEA
jgi:hypothetical protein